MNEKSSDGFWRCCVFCGAMPDEKTKEHVVPLWLQKFAGGQDRRASMFTLGGNVNLPWKNFTLPACASCNGHYAKLEALAKDAFIEIEGGSVSGHHLYILLDWLDKIRVGIWRLQLSLAKSAHTIAPNYAINSRLGTADRFIRILKYETESDGIGLIGTDTISFSLHPVAFALFVRNIVILSISASGFLQRIMKLTGSPRYVENGDQKFLVSSQVDLRNFHTDWGKGLLRYQSPRFFELQGFIADQHGQAMKPYRTGIMTDRLGRLQNVSDSEVFEVPLVSKKFGDVKLTSLLEVSEIQRQLMSIYDLAPRLKENNPFLAKSLSELDILVESTADVYDLIHPMPVYRRPL